jgi:hypothetical protein
MKKIVFPLIGGVLGVGSLVAACSGDDDVTTVGDAGGLPESSTDGAGPNDGSSSDGATKDSGSDVATDAPATDAEAGADVDAAVPVEPDGTYVLTSWTCGPAGGTQKDIKAFAATLGITGVTQVIAGTTGHVDVAYGATCNRTTQLTSITYSAPQKVTSTSAGAYTCSVTCLPAQCTAGTQDVLVDTFDWSAASSTYTYTRVLDATWASKTTLQKAAGCQQGETERAVYTKQ